MADDGLPQHDCRHIRYINCEVRLSPCLMRHNKSGRERRERVSQLAWSQHVVNILDLSEACYVTRRDLRFTIARREMLTRVIESSLPARRIGQRWRATRAPSSVSIRRAGLVALP